MWRRWGTPQNFLAINWWTLKNPKSQTSEKMKRIAGDIIILHICTKNTIIWGTVPEICSATEFFVILGHFLPCYQDMECDRQNCHFRPFFALLTHYWPRKLKFGKKVKKPWIYVLSFYTCVPKIKTIWCMVPEIWSAPDRIFCHLGPFFAPLPPTAGKMKISKMKKKPGDIIILQKCTKTHDHRLYCSWDMAGDRCNCYFLLWVVFCPFTP